MSKKTNICFSISLFLLSVSVQAQNNNPRAAYDTFKKQARQRYEDFRSKANKQYADFLAQTWKSFKVSAPVPKPIEKDVIPVKYDEELYRNHRRRPQLKEGEKEYEDDKDHGKHVVVVRHGRDGKAVINDDDGREADEKLKEEQDKKQKEEQNKKLKEEQKEEQKKEQDKREDDNRRIEIDEVITPPAPQPQPKPVSPIYEQEGSQESFPVTFFRLTCPVRLTAGQKTALKGVDERSVSAAWSRLSENGCDNAIRDLLELRLKYDLCDWSYLLLIDQVAQQFCGKNTNEAVLLMAYLYCQSGYKMRLASDGSHLYMLYASQHMIYNKRYFYIDGTSFYIYGDCNASSLHISDVSFPSETPLSLIVGKEQKLGVDMSVTRQLTSGQYPAVSITLSENKALMDFYSTYPTSKLGDNDVSRWALYANTPICRQTREQLYPALRRAIGGKTTLQQVSMILNWVQTAFVYEYDDKVWGGDRAFFPDETLYYPYCDCEDRSILFSRIVSDLLGLEVALLYYPGHLAAAVCFEENVNGDYLIIGGKKFVVTDPTYIGAPVGATMPGMDNKTAKAIVL